MIRAMLSHPVAIYALSVAFGKGLTLLTLPLVARHFSPAEFARLDLVASLAEPIGLLAGLALADTLFRFGITPERRQIVLERLLGLGLIIGAIMLLLVEFLLVPAFRALPNLPGEAALRTILAMAALGGLIELPLAFLRLSGRPWAFLAFVSARSLAQVGWLVSVLLMGGDVDTLLFGNAALDAAVILALLLTLPRGTRPRFDWPEFRSLLRYGIPVLAGGLCMFVLGSFDRWFLAPRVPAHELAHYALAAKLALALALAIQPFGLWWYPRRLGLLNQPSGREETARWWLLGVMLIALAGMAVMAFARVLISGLLPPVYQGALVWLPWLILIASLNELSSLSNGAAYARPDGRLVLATNAAAAALALALYLVLIPLWGITGALAATIAAQMLRVGLFLAQKHQGERIGFPLLPGLAMIAFSVPVNVAMAGDGFGAPTLMLLLGAVMVILMRQRLVAGLPALRP